MQKLVVTDVDGTLLERGEYVNKAEIESEIKRIIADGAVFAPISGRDIFSLYKLFRYAEKDIWFVACNGALCIRNGEKLISRPVSQTSVLEAIKSAKAHNEELVFSSDKTMYVYGSKKFYENVKQECCGYAKMIETAKDIDGEIYKISFFDENSVCGFDQMPFDLRISNFKNGWKEYVYKFADKGTALFEMQIRLCVSKTYTYAAGNEMADLDMLVRAANRYATETELAKEADANLVEMGLPLLKRISADIEKAPKY